MKIVNLAAPAIIDGALRYPVEGPFTVTDAEAAHLKKNAPLDGDPEDLPDEEQEETAKPKRGAASKES